MSNLAFFPIILQIKADIDVLEARIRKRIDKMINDEEGLGEIREIFKHFHDVDKSESSNVCDLDFTKGIL